MKAPTNHGIACLCLLILMGISTIFMCYFWKFSLALGGLMVLIVWITGLLEKLNNKPQN